MQSVKQSLREGLPGVSDASLDALSTALMHRGGSTRDLFSQLMKEGASPITIQSALFGYRDAILQGGRMSPDAVREVIRHVDRLGFLLLQAIAGFWQGRVGELEASLSVAGSELRLASARSRWLREGEVTLYNYFHEVPITARVAIHQTDDSGISVGLNADLVHVLAAGECGRFAHIRLPEVHSALRLEVESSIGQRVHFTYAGIFKTAEERRQHIRVLCDDAIPVVLRDASSAELHAVLRDISQAGFGLGMRQSSTVRVGDRFGFRIRLAGIELQGECSVCWLSQSGQVRFGVELDMALNLMHRLQSEVAHRQKRVITVLKMMGVPDCLL
ncbi:MAG: PilZ domain-containing protein [Mariprofundaceae bacterium]|nr:PilZ domain-containing protein [Mariprofundaceae bacterium]